MESVMPVNDPGERWPLWSGPLGASVLCEMTRREFALGPQAPSASVLSIISSSRLVRRERGKFGPIRILHQKWDPAFAQQPCQQAHRHPNDAVVGSPDRGDQAATFARYSVGAGLRLGRPQNEADRTERAGRPFIDSRDHRAEPHTGPLEDVHATSG